MITISLAMIIKDEEAVLERCLLSAAPCVDEIIIVDTGSHDHSMEIAEKYTKHIYHYPWNDDFASARNEAFSHATMDYILWLDADDIIPEAQQSKLIELKKTLTFDIDIVMMKYHIAFDSEKQPIFTYYRERLIRNDARFYWIGRIHETINLSGNIKYTDIAIHHHKLKQNDSMRNLRILKSLDHQNQLSIRERYYYAKELYEHAQYENALNQLQLFFNEKDAWVENQIDACRIKGHCLCALKRDEEALTAYFNSFVYDLPRAEILCDIAYLYMQKQQYEHAIYWYQAALSTKKSETSGAFIQHDCYDFIPFVQLCVCYDKLHDTEKAIYYHKQALRLKPHDPIVQKNNRYFKTIKDLKKSRFIMKQDYL